MSVIGVLIVVFFDRVSFYHHEAERLAYEQTVTALHAEVRLKAFALTFAGKPAEIATLAGQNPMGWLSQTPPNYLGEFYSPDAKKFASGNWFFDRSDGLLVYLLNQRNIFGSEDSELLKFKVSLLQESGTVDGVGRLELIPVQVRKKNAVN